jgi:hypothetical protein
VYFLDMGFISSRHFIWKRNHEADKNFHWSWWWLITTKETPNEPQKHAVALYMPSHKGNSAVSYSHYCITLGRPHRQETETLPHPGE